MADPVTDILTRSGQAKKAQTDGVSAEQHSLSEQIQVARFQAAAAGARKRNRGMMFSKLIPAAACPDRQGTGFAESSIGFDQPGE